MEIWYFR